MSPSIRSAMTPFPHAVEAEESLAEARWMMERHHIRHLPVKEGHRLVGVLTDRDIKLVLGPYAGIGDGQEMPLVRHACRFDVFTADVETPLVEVVAEMARRRIGSALITKEGRLAGIFTATDACRTLAELLGGPEDEHPDDEAA